MYLFGSWVLVLQRAKSGGEETNYMHKEVLRKFQIWSLYCSLPYIHAIFFLPFHV